MYRTLLFLILTLQHSCYRGFIYVAAAEDNQKFSRDEKKAFDALVKVIQQHPNGYVHPSIGLMAPAPATGAPRGIGIVKEIKKSIKNDILIQVPFAYQMTRDLALATLSRIIPSTVLTELPLHELDDAALLVLLLIHEYGLGKKSEFYAYLQTLPLDSCSFLNVDDFRMLPVGVDMEHLESGLVYMQRVSHGLANDYGAYLAQQSWTKDWKEDTSLALRWALCIVSSRGTAANTNPGGETIRSSDAPSWGVRLVPLADFANHLVTSGGFTELSGNANDGDYLMDTTAEDAGSFVVRSVWKDGSSKSLSKGDEITVNYNLPGYTAADWFLSLGFVPPELMSVGGGGGEL